MTQTLEDLLSLFLKREEIAPNVYRVSLAVGEHLVGVEIRAPDGALFLRALPLEALPEALAQKAIVRERLTQMGDIVKAGRLGRDDAGRPILEVDLAGLDGTRETYFGVLEAVAIDCARLRGAAEGLSAGFDLAQTLGQRTPAPGATAAPAAAKGVAAPGGAKSLAPLDAPAPGRTRLWENMMQAALPPSLQKLARDKREETLTQGATAKAAEKASEAPPAAPPEPPPPAPLPPSANTSGTFRLGAVPLSGKGFMPPPGLSPMEPASEPSSTWEDLERELLGANPENPPSQHSSIPGAGRQGMLSNVPPPSRGIGSPGLAGTESSQIFASLTGDAQRPGQSDEADPLDIFNAPPKPVAKAAEGFGDGFMEDLPSSPSSPPKGARDASDQAPPKRTSLFAGGSAGTRPTPQSHPSPPPASQPPAQAAPASPADEPRAEPPVGRPKKIGFFQGQAAGALAVPPGSNAPAGVEGPPGMKGRKSLLSPGGGSKEPREAQEPAKAAPSPTRRFEKFDLPSNEKKEAPAREAAEEHAPPAAPARPAAGGPARLEGGAGGGGGAHATPSRAEVKRSLAESGATGGGDLLSWMDDVAEADASGALAPLEEEPPPRKKSASTVIPKGLLSKVKEAAREWYRRHDRESMNTEVKKGNDALYVSTGEVPGERSWRFRQQTFRLSRPPIEAGAFTYQPDPTELTIEEIEAWLLSETMLKDEDVANNHRAQKLFEKAWTLRAEEKLGEAEAALREVLELQPDNVLAMTALGHLYRKELQQPDEALKLYGKALEKAPKFAPALLGRAALQVESDRHKAYEEAMSALALSPRDPDLLELAGIVALRANRKARAKELFVKLYRVDRARGEMALDLVDVERAGEAKWDPRLVIWERKALAKGDADSVAKALFEERIALAKRYDDVLREWKDLGPEQKRGRLSQLSDAPSYSFFFDLLPLYAEETDETAHGAIEDLFKSSPAQANMALEDAVLSGDLERAVGAFQLASVCNLPELVKPALDAYRRMTLGRHLRAFGRELVNVGGGDAALALLAKLERGEREAFDLLMELLGRRPDEPAEEAASAIHAALSVKGGVGIEEDDREQLLAAAEPSAEELAERSSTIQKKEQRMKRLKELENELGGGTAKKKKGGEEEYS